VSIEKIPSSAAIIADQLKGQIDIGAAAFLAEPYVTIAGEQIGERVLADLDQGATTDFAIDGYVATQAWVQKYPKTAAAFVRAIEEGQALANSVPNAVQAAMAKSDNLPLKVTALMSEPGFPKGPVDEERIQREAQVMLQFGVLGTEYTTQVGQGTLVASMVGPAS
jgi:NitT/TauT family transport system substrate-binding protein